MKRNRALGAQSKLKSPVSFFCEGTAGTEILPTAEVTSQGQDAQCGVSFAPWHFAILQVYDYKAPGFFIFISARAELIVIWAVLQPTNAPALPQ